MITKNTTRWQREEQPDRLAPPEQGDQAHQGQGHGPHGKPVRNRRVPSKGDHEGQQVQGQRYYPEEGGRGDVGADMGGDTQQQGRGQRGIDDPDHALTPARAQPCCRRGRDANGAPPQQAATPGDAYRQDGKTNGPGDRLSATAEQRFEHERKRQQGEHTAEVTRAVQEVRVVGVRMAGMRKPALEQRRGRRHGEEGGAD